jgi:hypothetical protein
MKQAILFVLGNFHATVLVALYQRVNERALESWGLIGVEK